MKLLLDQKYVLHLIVLMSEGKHQMQSDYRPINLCKHNTVSHGGVCKSNQFIAVKCYVVTSKGHVLK